jgi:hypothetical protein
MTDASQSPKKFADGGLTEEERRMLGALGPSSGAASRESGPAGAPVARPPAPAAPASPAAGLSEGEEMVLRQAKEESRRLTQAALERMFDRSGRPSEPTAGFEALLSQEPVAESPKSAAEPKPRGRLSRAVDAVLDVVNAPFQWLPRSFRMGLGLCGALLLITLLLVILIRALHS